MAQYPMSSDAVLTTPYAAEERVTAFLRSVYGWMCVGLAITALVAWYVASSPSLVMTIARTPFLALGLMVVQLGLVGVLSFRVSKMAASTAAALFIGYSALTGVTLSFVLLAYTLTSVASTFVIASGTFGAMALFGT